MEEQKKVEEVQQNIEEKIDIEQNKLDEKEIEEKQETKVEEKEDKPILERIYTIKLGKAYEKPRTKRARYAILLIKKFVEKHFRVEKDMVLIDQNLNEVIWERGIKRPPRKVRVLISKFKDGKVKVSLITASS